MISFIKQLCIPLDMCQYLKACCFCNRAFRTADVNKCNTHTHTVYGMEITIKGMAITVANSDSVTNIYDGRG